MLKFGNCQCPMLISMRRPFKPDVISVLTFNYKRTDAATFIQHSTNAMRTVPGLIAFVVALAYVHYVLAVHVETFGHLFHPEQDEHHHQQHEHREEKQDLTKIPGVPGVDYPIYHEVPQTNFHCAHVPAVPGMYANVETGCQAYHVCNDGREGHQGASFLCTNGTIFNQKEFTCDWWYNVKCDEAINYYHLNADPEHNPYFPKKKHEEPQQIEQQHHEHDHDHHHHQQHHQHNDFLIHA